MSCTSLAKSVSRRQACSRAGLFAAVVLPKSSRHAANSRRCAFESRSARPSPGSRFAESLGRPFRGRRVQRRAWPILRIKCRQPRVPLCQRDRQSSRSRKLHGLGELLPGHLRRPSCERFGHFFFEHPPTICQRQSFAVSRHAFRTALITSLRALDRGSAPNELPTTSRGARRIPPRLPAAEHRAGVVA